MAKNIYVEVKTNIPEMITPKFRTWKEWENEGTNGKYKTYSIGVEWRGQDAYFSVNEGVYRAVFEPLGDLQDRTLEILKYEDGKYKRWKVMENGVEITPKAKNGAAISLKPQTTPYTQKEPNTPYTPKFASQEQIAKINENIQKMVKKIVEMEMNIDGLMGALITKKNEKAFELHKATTKPLRDKMETKQREQTEEEKACYPDGEGDDEILIIEEELNKASDKNLCTK